MEKSVIKESGKSPKDDDAEIVELSPTAEKMKQTIAKQLEKRGLLDKYMDDHFVEGVHFRRTCRRKHGDKWKPEYLEPEEDMLKGDKPGKKEISQEGAQAILDVTESDYTDGPDKEIIDMMGEDAKGQIILKGIVKDADGAVIGYGRGACSLKEKYGSANNAIKQAQVRCKRNGVINTFALSREFTQDIDDVNNQDLAKKIDKQQEEKTNMMREYIEKIMKESKVTEKERGAIDLVFDNGVEYYNILRFVNEITDPDIHALMGTVGKNKGRAHVMEIAKFSGCKLSEFESMLRTDK